MQEPFYSQTRSQILFSSTPVLPQCSTFSFNGVTPIYASISERGKMTQDSRKTELHKPLEKLVPGFKQQSVHAGTGYFGSCRGQFCKVADYLLGRSEPLISNRLQCLRALKIRSRILKQIQNQARKSVKHGPLIDVLLAILA